MCFCVWQKEHEFSQCQNDLKLSYPWVRLLTRVVLLAAGLLVCTVDRNAGHSCHLSNEAFFCLLMDADTQRSQPASLQDKQIHSPANKWKITVAHQPLTGL